MHFGQRKIPKSFCVHKSNYGHRKISCLKLFYQSENLTHINLELNRNPCRHSRRNLFSVFEISLCVGLSGTFLLISTSIVGDISRYIDTAYYLGYTNCPSIHVRSYTDLSLTIYFSHFYYPPKQPLSTQPLSLL